VHELFESRKGFRFTLELSTFNRTHQQNHFADMFDSNILKVDSFNLSYRDSLFLIRKALDARATESNVIIIIMNFVDNFKVCVNISSQITS